MKRYYEIYINNVSLIGALYCIVPSLAVFALAAIATPFREVYILRLALSCTVGGYIAARLNKVGLQAWLDKLRWSKQRTNVMDGVVIGSTTGLGVCLLPPLTLLIAPAILHDTLLFIAVIWLSGLIAGGIIGGLLASTVTEYIGPGELEGVR